MYDGEITALPKTDSTSTTVFTVCDSQPSQFRRGLAIFLVKLPRSVEMLNNKNIIAAYYYASEHFRGKQQRAEGAGLGEM